MELEQDGATDYDREISKVWESINSDGNKLDILIKASNVRVEYVEDLYNKRSEYDSLRFGLRDKCFTCGNNAIENHHIIQLKHGGRNEYKNIVSLCYKCHTTIHPWLKNQSFARKQKKINKPHLTLKQVLKDQKRQRRTHNQ